MPSSPRPMLVPSSRLPVVLLASLLAAASLALCAAPPPVAGAAGATRSPIRHVIEIMLENHTFDDLFASFPGSNGIPNGTELPDPAAGGRAIAPFPAPPDEGDVQAGMDNSRTSELFAMHRVATTPAGAAPGRSPGAGTWAMDRFTLVPGSGLSSITTFPPSFDPDLQYLARHYELADDNFQPIVGPTQPNVVAALAGTAHKATTNDDVPTVGVSWHTIFDQLSAAGLSSAIFYGVRLSVFEGTVWPELLPAGDPGALSTTTQFLADLAGGDLPAFSFVRPGVGYSEEPPEDVGEGDLWLGQLLSAIARSPEWPSTAVFITYDEGGGFYDHVPPPVVTAYGYGTRTPLVIVSPSARHGVFSEETTNLSVLAFVEHLFGLPPLDSLVASQNDLGAAFDLAAGPAPAPRPPVAPPVSFAAYGSADRLSDVAALAPRHATSLLVEANTAGLALDTAYSGAIELAVSGPSGAADPLPSRVLLVRGVGHVPVRGATAGYYRVTMRGRGGGLGYLTLDVGVGPDTP
ncbi:MAG TPA: alkaline phosphatase family protein [Acidimicrobiales bacterium]|nr:alkaline phosphatase family protein [Acidimicrobiales bacterium]